MEGQIGKIQEILKKGLEETKNGQFPMNNAITEIKNALEVINSRMVETERKENTTHAQRRKEQSALFPNS